MEQNLLRKKIFMLNTCFILHKKNVSSLSHISAEKENKLGFVTAHIWCTQSLPQSHIVTRLLEVKLWIFFISWKIDLNLVICIIFDVFTILSMESLFTNDVDVDNWESKLNLIFNTVKWQLINSLLFTNKVLKNLINFGNLRLITNKLLVN